MRPALLVSALLAMLLGLAACDYRVKELKPGKSTAFEVRDVLGTPTHEWKEADGTLQWEFARGPQGVVTYMAIIGTDSVLKEFRQVLAPAYFAKVQPGQGKEEIRKLLGRPGETMNFPLKKEEVWSWRYEEGPNDPYQFHVHFDLDGKVVTTSRSRIGEPR
jgi:hypothetical protein